MERKEQKERKERQKEGRATKDSLRLLRHQLEIAVIAFLEIVASPFRWSLLRRHCRIVFRRRPHLRARKVVVN